MNNYNNASTLSTQKGSSVQMDLLVHDQKDLPNKKTEYPSEYLLLKINSYPFTVDWQMHSEEEPVKADFKE